MFKNINFKVRNWFGLMLWMLVSNGFSQTMNQKDGFEKCYLPPESIKQQLTETKTHFYLLTNGLRVYIRENHSLPVFAMRMLFNVGAADESKKQHGYAHFFEHMMFKGSKHIADGEHFSLVKQMGGHLNASTDYDRTEYWTEAPVRFLDNVLWLEAERLTNLGFSTDKVNNQRQAILEEKLLRIDNVPYYKVASEFMISAWQGTPYDHMVIGNRQSLDKADAQALKAFFTRYYTPDNAVLVLVGDLEPQQTINKVRKYFETSWHPGERHKNFTRKQMSYRGMAGAQPSRREGKKASIHDPLAPFPLYALGWHTPGKNNPDFYAVELLADILFKDDSSRIRKRLKKQEQQVFEMLGMPLTFEQLGITAVAMVPHSYTRFEQIKSVVQDELGTIQAQGVSDSELCAAIKYRQLSILNNLENNRVMAQYIGDGVLFFNDPDYALSAFSAYQQVSHRQIKQVAKRYFHNDWLALEITPGVGVRLLKWFMENLPEPVSKSLEQQFL